MHLKVKEIVRFIIVKIFIFFSSFCLNHSMLFYLIKFIFKIGYVFKSGVKLVRLQEKKVEPKSTHCFVGN